MVKNKENNALDKILSFLFICIIRFGFKHKLFTILPLKIVHLHGAIEMGLNGSMFKGIIFKGAMFNGDCV